jgi:hypothetical protein
MKKQSLNSQKTPQEKIDLSFLADKWPSAIVSRDQIGKFTGGILSPKRLANLDSLGEGPQEGVIRCGNRKIAYVVKPFLRWLETRMTLVR